MNFNKLKNGNQLKIKGNLYEVLYVQEEADVARPPEYRVDKITAVYLHDRNSKSLYPTHVLQNHHGTNDIYMQRTSFVKRTMLFSKRVNLKQSEIMTAK